MKRLLPLFALTLLIAVSSYAGFCAFRRVCGEQPIKAKIGLIAPLSGENFRYGLGMERGILLAQKDLGLREVELISQDTHCSPDEIDRAISNLISQGVIAIIGEACSGATLKAVPLINENRVVLISPASTSPQLSNSSDYFFRTIPSDALQGEFAARLVQARGFKRLAIVYSNEPYGQDFNTVLSQKFTELGGTITISKSFTLGSINLRPELNDIKKTNPDALYIISNSLTSSAAIVVQAKELNLKAQLFGSEALRDRDFLRNAGSSAEGLIISSVTEGTSDFRRKFELTYQTRPILFSAQAYDAFYALGLALKQGARTGPELKDFLKTISFEGVSGRIQFRNNDLVESNYSIYEVKDGDFILAGIESLL